jgi:glycosyltransferase involved in cell wall biosynthesis
MINIMKKLGNDYHLNILPGTFSKPDLKYGRNKFGPEKPEEFKWLVDYFSSANNITIHKPVEWGEHWNYLYHSDLAIDFSPNSGCQKHLAGNAKLLEYLASGLPVVVETGPGNLQLLKDCNGGIIIKQASDFLDYVDGIYTAIKHPFDRNKISNITITNQNWGVRAKNIISIIGSDK